MFSEENTSVPPEFNWEQMEEGIYSKMDAIKEPSRPKRTFRRIIGLVIIAILLLLIPFWCTRNKGDKNAGLNGTAQHEAILKSENRDHSFSKESNTLPTKADEAESTTLGDGSNSRFENEGLNLSSREVSVLQKELNDDQAIQGGAYSLSTAKDLTNNKIGTTPVNKMPEVRQREYDISGSSNNEQEGLGSLIQDNYSEDENISENEGKYPELAGTESSSVLMLKNSISSLELEQENLSWNSTIQVYQKEPETAPNALDRTRVIMLGGISGWNMGFGTEAPERSPYEQTILSYSAQVGITFPLKKGYFLMSGLSYQQLESRLDWSMEIDDYVITLTDTVIEVRTNLISREGSKEIYGDIDVVTSAERVVRHYNKTQLYQVPLAIGKSWSVKNWQFDAMIGSSVNIYTSNRGRTLYNGELIDYDDTETPFMSNQWKIHGLLAGQITYKVSENLGVSAGLQFQQSLSDWDPDQDLKMYPRILQFQCGLTYYLKK